MEILLENIATLLLNKSITEKQALYLIYLYNESAFIISGDLVLDLVDKMYIKSNKVHKSLLTTTSGVVNELTGTILPIHKSDISKQLPKKLCKLFCVTDGKGGLLLSGGTEENAVEYTASKYLQKEGLITYHYLIMLFMFPVAGRTNRRWEKHFTKEEYKGPRLRLRSKVHGRKFKAIARKKDMGIFLYGTYLYISSCIQGNKSYITTVNKYLDEYEEWYNEAADIINNNSDIKKLFKRNDSRDIVTMM